MIAVQHFGSMSGGKDSQAVLCKMVERIERRGLAAFGNRAPRFLSADNGHENPITLDHIAYLDDWLCRRVGLRIETVSANDVPGLTDAAVICPPLSGPETMIVWTMKGTLNAEQEAQAGRDHRQAA